MGMGAAASMFERRIQEAFDSIQEVLEEAVVVQAGGLLDVDATSDMLTIQTPCGVFVVSKHTASQQLWIASPVSGAHRCEYDTATSQWVSQQAGCSAESLLSSDLQGHVKMVWPMRRR